MNIRHHTLKSPVFAHPFIVVFALFFPLAAPAATVTLQTTELGSTPEVVGCNLGHFAENTNVSDWWDYFGVKAARVFVSPSIVEPTDDIPIRGDGVTDRASFLTRRSAMNANVFNSAYINWTAFNNNYANAVFTGGNYFKLDPAFSAMRSLGIDILVNITASLSRFDISSSEDWAGKWELWQHYYAQAFYLARYYDVRRYSIFNEPNHEAAGGITPAQWQERLELASDAIQRGVAYANNRYGKSLVPLVYAPTTAGHNETIWQDWGLPAVQLRHRKFDGTTYSGYFNFNQYTFQNYGANGHTDGSTFTDKLNDLNAKIAPVMSGETPFRLALTEFNSLPNYIFQQTTHTMDTPQRFAQLGSISIRLAAGYVQSMYVFKFAQTAN